ncbi:Pimeloyl-ACP methyl ester carboxylesterase [Pustulibacterium marinum]|uniref:Pimeloyl-ACP methyl ester carboxylesterase n=1 Tax=Pustulibacterium marinum TaxID=1224947 RepID=A0A1I7IPZ6_9FLAO|nr:alpha/beta hydrolase [Pustulibacterium marinum]SFU74971.1 Pimeloyl-ACP methyl ester carboxylesterase [Pustulibacterium marinum]
MKRTLVLLCVLFSTILFAQTDSTSVTVKSLDAKLTGYEYPYPVLYLILKEQKGVYNMAYMDVKPKNYNGRNVLLFHGKNFNGAYWKSTIDTLTAQGYRVIAPDQIGFGKSDKPENFQYSFAQLAQNTRALLMTLEIEKTAVLGHSMGGMLATRFALMYPEVTDRLVLENPIGLEDYQAKIPYLNVDWWYQNELNKDYAIIKKYQKDNYYGGVWKADYDPYVNILAGWAQGKDKELIAWNNALTYDMILTQPVVHEFKDLKCPVLLIIGTRDRTAIGKALVKKEVKESMGQYNKLGRETRTKIPNSKLVEIENVGHIPHLEAFKKFMDPLLNFLAK